jgi:hypothetical protein
MHLLRQVHNQCHYWYWYWYWTRRAPTYYRCRYCDRSHYDRYYHFPGGARRFLLLLHYHYYHHYQHHQWYRL